MARKAAVSVNFRTVSYNTINSFNLENFPDGPDIGEQIGDLILALEDRLGRIRETSPMDKYLSGRMEMEQRFLELASDLDWPVMNGGDLYGLAGPEQTTIIGYDRYYHFASIASRELLEAALSGLAGIEEARKDAAIEVEDAAKKAAAAALAEEEADPRPMGVLAAEAPDYSIPNVRP